ncbi:hypothetical protein HANVADRAFT_48206 [Hanseniaspora valbyensis NRRL Y-1626]|uniref:NGG1p interacting factor 3 n=1 Tax=Hanseniaspora valbyensis NRRL Y-1626 TaxID=766949 RepID=A0A1B7TFQ0_9ASCO|nr:hypothetical protein HANVADRAFT_48206 [Hanseniaspora valbyensis NRRL Y-1626]
MSKISNNQLQALVKVITKAYPKAYADNKWDNTGLLINSALSNNSTVFTSQKQKVLLTIDLTKEVCQEAIDKKVDLILAYHPFIFPKWNAINETTQHESAIKLIQNGISVYSPHTAVDAVKNGMNDMLIDILKGDVKADVVAIEQSKASEDPVEGFGRVFQSDKEQNLSDTLDRIKKNLGINHLQIAIPSEYKKLSDFHFKSGAVCAGSGASVFNGLKSKVELILTGEMSHHDALRYKQQGTCVIVVNHSNSERAYLSRTMKCLLDSLSKEADLDVEWVVSETDIDPLQVY